MSHLEPLYINRTKRNDFRLYDISDKDDKAIEVNCHGDYIFLDKKDVPAVFKWLLQWLVENYK